MKKTSILSISLKDGFLLAQKKFLQTYPNPNPFTMPNYRLPLIISLFALSISLTLSCKPDEPGCERVDCGTCGNACCKLRYEFPHTTDAQHLRDNLFKTLSNGGPDQRYALQATAEGTFGFADLRQFNVTRNGNTYLYLGQADHQTEDCPYHDLINFDIYQRGEALFLEVFSISKQAGSLCDIGQNYKNIYDVIKKAGIDVAEETVFGCPKP